MEAMRFHLKADPVSYPLQIGGVDQTYDRPNGLRFGYCEVADLCHLVSLYWLYIYHLVGLYSIYLCHLVSLYWLYIYHLVGLTLYTSATW